MGKKMKSEITELNVTRTATTLAFLAAIISLFFAIIGILTMMFNASTDITFKFIIPIHTNETVVAFFLYLLYPFFILATTYISVVVLCKVYNLVAKYTGGITIHTKPL